MVYTLYEDQTGNSFDAIAFPANGTAGIAFAIGAKAHLADNSRVVQWRTLYTGGPTAVDVSLQGSLDNSAWFTLDNSTETAGEFRTVTNVRAKFLRAILNSRTDGTLITVTILA